LKVLLHLPKVMLPPPPLLLVEMIRRIKSSK
jgi:hypothetical protein